MVGSTEKQVKKKRRKTKKEERNISDEIAQKATAQRTVGQSVKQKWDSSQIENAEEEEDMDWHEGDQMEVQWAEDEKWRRVWNEEGWKEVLCRRKSCRKYLSLWYMNECPKVKK